jgi:phospholipid-binding lipoprotein MlaA
LLGPSCRKGGHSCTGFETFDEIEMNSLDFYASVRSLYRQTRTNEIKNGMMPIEDLPDF